MWYNIIPCTKKKDSLSETSREEALVNLNRRWSEIFDPYFDTSAALFSSSLGVNAPPLDVIENEKEIQVSADFPGFNEKEVNVRLDGNVLYIEANKAEEKEEKNSAIHRQERRAGRFERVLSLPEGRVDRDKITAVLKNGVLKIHLPKIEDTSTKKTIEIKTA